MRDERFTPISEETERVAREVIGAAIAVHRQLGPGFVERIYRRSLCVELRFREVQFEQHKRVAVTYRGEPVSIDQLDLVVGGVVVVELKAVKELRPIHQAQVLSYLKASGCRIGLLLNFNVMQLVHGLHRFVR